MNLTRRRVIGGAAAFALGGWRVFASPPGCKPQRSPNLVFGVLSDTHLRISRNGGYDAKRWPDRYLVAALEYFKSQNVDAVVHCGDMADRGVIDEMQFHANAWRKVFGLSGPVKLFVTGNHDVEGGGYGSKFRLESVWANPDERARHLLVSDMAGNWERVWGEPYEKAWHKIVKGYHFFGLHYGAAESDLERLVEAESDVLGKGTKPFFFVSHIWTHHHFNKAVKCVGNGFGIFGHWTTAAPTGMYCMFGKGWCRASSAPPAIRFSRAAGGLAAVTNPRPAFDWKARPAAESGGRGLLSGSMTTC